MVTAASPTALALNLYITANPAELAQNKYTKQLWKERYAYITMVAYAALATVATYFLSPLVLPMTLIYFNFGVLSVASNLVLPKVMEWFAAAKKLKAQGDREAQIQTKLQELQALEISDLTKEFSSRELPCNVSAINLQSLNPLLARIIYWEGQSTELKRKNTQLRDENKFKEALEASVASDKARLKAAYYGALISHPEHPGKFKGSFSWIPMSTEERAFRISSGHESGRDLAQPVDTTRDPINNITVQDNSIGALAEILMPRARV